MRSEDTDIFLFIFRNKNLKNNFIKLSSPQDIILTLLGVAGARVEDCEKLFKVQFYLNISFSVRLFY